MTAAVCLLAVAGWFTIVIWAAWRGRWVTGSIAGVLFVGALVQVGRIVAGPRPLAFGLTFGLSLFLGAALLLVGLIANVVALIVHHRDD